MKYSIFNRESSHENCNQGVLERGRNSFWHRIDILLLSQNKWKELYVITRILHPWAGWRTPLATPNIKLRVIVPFLRLWKCSPVHAIVYIGIDCWNAINRWMATAIGRTPLTLLTCQKVVVFFGTFVCTSKGYVERETSLSLITCQKVVVFLAI